MKDLQATHKKLLLFMVLEGICLKRQTWKDFWWERQWDGKNTIANAVQNMGPPVVAASCFGIVSEKTTCSAETGKRFLSSDCIKYISQWSCQISSRQCFMSNWLAKIAAPSFNMFSQHRCVDAEPNGPCLDSLQALREHCKEPCL